MSKATPLPMSLAAYLALLSPLVAASQIVTYTYDASGRITAVTYTGKGAPNGCTTSTPTWGTGTFGCLRWTP